MKCTALGALVLIVSVAASGAERQRYVVGTKRSAQNASIGSLSASLRDPAERRARSFRVIDGFAADLTPEEASALRRSPDVRWVERAVERHLMASVSKPGQQLVPYGITQVGAPKAWWAHPVASVNVAVIDSGIDYQHPELASAYGGGYHVLTEAKPPLDDLGHGTHVAGIIGAANNAYGVVGVAPGIRLWAIKAIDDSGSGTMENVIAGLDWVVAKKSEIGGRWIVNMSLGGPDASIAEREAFIEAEAAGVILVASSGNESTVSTPAPVAYPAAYPEVIGVGAVDDASVHATFSNSGPELDFVAPGVRIVSTVLTGGAFVSYIRSGGTIITSKPLVGAKIGTITADFIYCGLGEAKDFGPEVRGKIALIKRGGDTFADKARRANEAGAVAVAFFNHDTTNISFTLFPEEDPAAKNYPWPIAVAMTKADGESLAAKGSGRITIAYEPDDYGIKNGTSMAAPHVAGALALLWSLAPDATSGQLLNALVTTAKDLGPAGRDDEFGHGQIDVFAAAKMIAPSAFVPTTGRRILTRRRH
jgi:serine protease